MILFLGGNGFLGRSIIPFLLNSGHSIRVLDRNFKNTLAHPRLQYIHGNFSNIGKLDIFKNVHTVIHAISTTTPSSSDIKQDIIENIIPSTILFEKCASLGIKKLLFFSSGGTVYGNHQQKQIETDAHFPICSYGISKLTIEKYMMMYSDVINVISLRISNPYGPEQFHLHKKGVIATFLHRVQNNHRCEVWGKLSIKKDYIYIKDLNNIVEKVIQSQVPSGIYNVGYGKSYTLQNIIDIIEEITGKKIDIQLVNKKSYDVQNVELDTEKITSMLDWIPNVDLQSGILQMYNDLLQNSNSQNKTL